MLSQIVNSSFRILLFRGGPQDFPFAPGLRLPMVLVALVANAAVAALVVSPLLALVASAATIAGLALVTRSVLRARQMDNRYDQTFQALLVTSTLLSLMMLLPMTQLAPLAQQLQENPELAKTPDALDIPGGAILLMMVFVVWNFAVTAHIFRHAAETRLWVGVLIALIAMLAVQFIAAFGGSIVNALGGGG